LNLNTQLGLPQFIISLTGTSGAPSSVTVKLTWTGNIDASCEKTGITVGPSTTTTAPVNTSAPKVTGTPTPGHTLACSQGTWSNSPTSFSYQWKRNGTAISGATHSTYVVQIADEGSVLSCTVVASNASGAGAGHGSQGVVVAQPGTLRCQRPSGHVKGVTLGPIRLGMTRKQARKAVHPFTAFGDIDRFCLYGGWGIRVGYPGQRLLRTLSVPRRHQLNGIAVLALTANPFYNLDGIHPGARLSVARRHLHLGRPFHIGANVWYLVAGRKAIGVFKVRHGIIQEVGLANKRLLSGSRHSRDVFLDSFKKS
jgi:hypothetical protein